MKKLIISIVAFALSIGAVAAAVRGTDSLLRTNSATSAPAVRDGTVVSRTATKTTNRTDAAQRVNSTRARTGARPTVSSRTTDGRGTRTNATGTNARAGRTTTNARATTTTNLKSVPTNTFNIQQNECQDAYFACMDQFCAVANDKYRRCICSSRLETIKARERVLNQTSEELQDFQNLNIAAILKTPAEVKAMLTASEGELKLTKTRDTSESSKKLTAISDVLSGTRSNALSTAGQLDIGGDIKQIWNTTDLISGASIANLTGESLYNAVHSQCAELIADRCPSQTTLNMVVSAYGMYIENDCTIILSNLDKQSTNANTAIRQTNREMHMARLENYDAHNSTAINDCIAGVRESITADTACGKDYVHCLDLTGLYLNRSTGAPIYSADFYKLNDQVSLSGDVLTNPTNAKLVTELNNKRKFAEKTLETCRDIADSVWDEFMRQAITEIYQGTQSKIRQVKNECMDVVNDCYDEKTNQLRDFSNIEDQMLLGDRLVLSEKMCTEQLTTCSNLYGGGSTGLQLLISEMRSITDQKIAQNCLVTLNDYAKKLCRVSGSDTLHDYPYGCRVYNPGNVLYAQNPMCTYLTSPDTTAYTQKPEPAQLLDIIDFTINQGDPLSNFSCWENRIYTRCNENYFLANNKCYKCPTGWTCPGEREPARPGADACSPDYVGSLYQKMVVYALQYCARPETTIIPTDVLANVNTVMDSIKKDMATILASECDRLGGVWTTTFQTDSNGEPVDNKFTDFYNETNANLGWGLCREP